MNKSDSITKLAAALAKAQGEMKHASKDSNNPHFKSKYADMAAVVEATREPFAKHGLSCVQGNDIAEGNGVIIETMLMHESGEWLLSRLLVPVTKWDAQGIGSAMTYGRRYSLMAMAGLAADDDDGESAVGRGSAPTKYAEAKPAPVALITAEKAADLKALATENGVDAEKFFGWCSGKFGYTVSKWGDIHAPDHDRAMNALDAKRAKGAA